MRPPSIQLFDKALFAGLAVSVVSTAISWNAVSAVVRDPRLAALGLGQGFVVLSVVLGFAIYLLLWFFIARRASTIAKWIFAVLTAGSVLNFVQALATRTASVGLLQALAAAALVLQVYAAWLLFRPDAQAWFEADDGDLEQRGPVE